MKIWSFLQKHCPSPLTSQISFSLCLLKQDINWNALLKDIPIFTQ